MGQTPWSARVPLDPLFLAKNPGPAKRKRATRGPAADEGVRPTNRAGVRPWENDGLGFSPAASSRDRNSLSCLSDASGYNHADMALPLAFQLAGSHRLLSLSGVDMAIIAIYFVAVLAIGFYLKGKAGTGEDFFLAGREMTAWIAGLSFSRPTSARWN